MAGNPNHDDHGRFSAGGSAGGGGSAAHANVPSGSHGGMGPVHVSQTNQSHTHTGRQGYTSRGGGRGSPRDDGPVFATAGNQSHTNTGRMGYGKNR